MVNFYRKFLPGAARVLVSLTDTLKGPGKSLTWSPVLDFAFTKAKDFLSSVLELVHKLLRQLFAGLQRYLAVSISLSLDHRPTLVLYRARGLNYTSFAHFIDARLECGRTHSFCDLFDLRLYLILVNDELLTRGDFD